MSKVQLATESVNQSESESRMMRAAAAVEEEEEEGNDEDDEEDEEDEEEVRVEMRREYHRASSGKRAAS